MIGRRDALHLAVAGGLSLTTRIGRGDAISDIRSMLRDYQG